MIKNRPRCGKPSAFSTEPKPGRPRRWCSQVCRRLASEERRAAEAGGNAITYGKESTSLDEHVRAVLDSPGACERLLRASADRDARRALADAK